jgi:hypothetical protein
MVAWGEHKINIPHKIIVLSCYYKFENSLGSKELNNRLTLNTPCGFEQMKNTFSFYETSIERELSYGE